MIARRSSGPSGPRTLRARGAGALRQPRSGGTDILPKLRDFESMTWAEIMRAAGGRARGSNSHFVEVRNLTGHAKQRLAEIGQDDVSELFSLRLSATVRIYGIRDRRALKLLWYDPHHGANARAGYPVCQR